MTVFCTYPLGPATIWEAFSTNCRSVSRASTTMPTSMVTASAPSSSSVVAAFLLFGFLNAGTPLEMASTPVSAAQPEENVRNSRKNMAAAGEVVLVRDGQSGARRAQVSGRARRSGTAR